MSARGETKDEGFVLLAVIGFLLLAGSIATHFLVQMRDYSLLERNAARSVKAEITARSIGEIAALRYRELADRQRALPREVGCILDDRRLAAISFVNHAGLIDVNAAPAEVLEAGFVSLGATRDEARRLVPTVEAYRSPHFTGQPSDDPIVGGPKHAPYESIAELLDLRLPAGIGLDQIAGTFTIYTRNGVPDLRFASEALKRALATNGDEPPAHSGPAPLTAISVEVRLQEDHADIVSRRSNFRIDTLSGTFRQVGPTWPVLADSLSTLPDSVRTNCEAFFDEKLIALLREAAS